MKTGIKLVTELISLILNATNIFIFTAKLYITPQIGIKHNKIILHVANTRGTTHGRRGDTCHQACEMSDSYVPCMRVCM